jgi:hypothetical protein
LRRICGRRAEHSDRASSDTIDKIVSNTCERVDLGSAIAGDGDTASKLAARRLERVLLRGSKARLALAIAGLARDLAPRSAAAKGSIVETLEHAA